MNPKTQARVPDVTSASKFASFVSETNKNVSTTHAK